MRFIPITPARVDILKRQAKRLHRAGGGKHAALLDQVARSAGFDHWHHVTLCLQESDKTRLVRGLMPEIDAIIGAELAGEVRVVLTGPEASTSQPFLLFASGIGDAWLLDPVNDQATCLMWRHDRQTPTIIDEPTRLSIGWDGSYELRGSFFVVDTNHALIQSRAIAGYPLDQLRSVLEQVYPVERRIDAIFNPETTVEITPEIIEQLHRTGWEIEALESAARQGARYSPSRNTVLFPSVAGD